MASKTTNANTSLCFLFLLFFALSMAVPESGSEALVYTSNLPAPVKEFGQLHELREERLWRLRNAGTRRVMVGSRVPLCTYYECRGCRFKCSAEQVPVDASDPINSSYHYKCVCHR
ncbi:hypothetical protein Cni_G03210 [Canna indica]|uniref:Stomagen C-terminal domain-containing protein n=1 Tax=Canna indica TaxID=4628 RepID=A0AAQ3JQU9_9LILI|nr:hypothetical protein Cni_G03210 [Canna indica]